MSPNLVDEGWFKSDTEVVIKEHIPYTEIESLLEAARFDLGSFKPQVATFIWLIANIYYGDSYYFYLDEYGMTDVAIEGAIYEAIANENLLLFLALKEYMRVESLALTEKYNWEKAWTETHNEERQARKRLIIKEYENDFGKIEGEDWKEREAIYDRMADSRLDKEMGKEMRSEKEWISLNKKLKDAQSITIRFGKQEKTVIPNSDFWVNKLLENHVFPRFIPEYNSVEEAKEALKKPAGRPSEDIRVRTLAYGFSRFFLDNEIITTSTSRDLLFFLEKLFAKMDIRCNNGKYPDWLKLEDVIQNSAAAPRKPRFFTPDDRKRFCNVKKLEDPTPQDILNWLDTPEVIFKHISE